MNDYTDFTEKYQVENNKSTKIIILIVICLVLGLIICAIAIHKFLNRKYKREANRFIKNTFKFEENLSYKKESREMIVRNYYNSLLLLISRYNRAVRKSSFLDYNTADILRKGIKYKLDEFYCYIEKIIEKDSVDYKVNENVSKLISNTWKKINETTGSYDPSFFFIWYTGKFSQYCSEMINIINILIENILQNSRNEDIRRICNEILSHNSSQKNFFDTSSPIYLRFMNSKDILHDRRKNYPDVQQFFNDFDIVKKRYLPCCLRYCKLMTKIYTYK